MFNENNADEIKLEKDFKKLVTVTKSKFYLLKINYPKLFEEVNSDEINFN